MAQFIRMFILAQAVFAAHALESFDYVIVGSGPAGLLAANRLSNNANITVAVIEAGESAYSNPNVTHLPRSITEFSPGIGTQIDWKYLSAPQKYSGNRTLQWVAGKALGGSTTLYGMTYLRAEKVQIDAWEELGNQGWTWSRLLRYYLAQERFHEPDAVQTANGAPFDAAVHGYTGELDVAFTPYLTGQGAFDTIRRTSEALGVPFNGEMNGGHMRGTSSWPMMLKPVEKVREDAATAFYFGEVESRSNLRVFLNTTATQILFRDGTYHSGVVASGVEVSHANGSIEVLQASKGVIVAAGSIQSPALLERSGVGNSAHLQSIGVKQRLTLEGLGSQLQDQPANGIAYTSTTNWTGYATFATYLTAADLFGNDLPTITKELHANTSAYAATIIEDYAPGAITQQAQEQLLKHQIDLIFTPNSSVPLAEILWFPVQTSIAAQFWNLLPLSRGSMHATSSNASASPSINPNFFQLPIDVYVQAAIAVKVREFFATPPLSQYVVAEASPSSDKVPVNASWKDPAWHTWIKETYNSNSHPVSSCAMMSEQLGGVVDRKGRVYGANNLWIVDASVFPTQISGHLTASILAIAGKIIDGIMGWKS